MSAPLTTRTITRFAPAKVNLYLHVTKKRDDGFHELDSLAVFADIGDTVTVVPGQGLSLSITGPFADDLDAGEDNLVLKAARALATHAGVRRGAHITLDKHLPVASGIGGGSADAAATLKALVDFWGIQPADDDIHHVAHDVSSTADNASALAALLTVWRDDVDTNRMRAIGLELGADVPACLEGRPVFMGGIGERLTMPPDLPTAWLVLVNPGVAVSTPDVFKARTGDFSDPARFFEPIPDVQALAETLKTRRNDLAAPAIALCPVIGDVIAAIDAQTGCLLARMSGSGATGFGLFDGQTTAMAAAHGLRAAHPDWWVEATQIIDSPFDI